MKRPQKLAVMLVPTPPYEICGLGAGFMAGRNGMEGVQALRSSPVRSFSRIRRSALTRSSTPVPQSTMIASWGPSSTLDPVCGWPATCRYRRLSRGRRQRHSRQSHRRVDYGGRWGVRGEGSA